MSVESKKVNYYILFPVLLFSSLAFATIDLDTVGPTLLVMVVTVIIATAALWIYKLLRPVPAKRFGVYMQSHIRYNTYMGLMLMGPLFGPKGVQLFAMIMVVAIPLVNAISIVALTEGNGLSIKQTIWSVVKNPLILGSVGGFLFNLTGIEIFSGLKEFMQLTGKTCLFLGLLCIGSGLQFRALRTALPQLSANTIGRLLLMPLLAFGVAYAFGLDDFETTVLVVFFGLPTATAAYILTKMMNGDSELMAGIISLQTLCFALSFPLLMWFLQ